MQSRKIMSVPLGIILPEPKVRIVRSDIEDVVVSSEMCGGCEHGLESPVSTVIRAKPARKRSRNAQKKASRPIIRLKNDHGPRKPPGRPDSVSLEAKLLILEAVKANPNRRLVDIAKDFKISLGKLYDIRRHADIIERNAALEASTRPAPECGGDTRPALEGDGDSKPALGGVSDAGPAVEAAREIATSTTPSDEQTPKQSSLPAEVPEWSIEDVISYIAQSDPVLGVHAELFRKHEIDGKALLLLNSDMMMKYMGLKLGPALKICNLVTKISKNRRCGSGGR